MTTTVGQTLLCFTCHCHTHRPHSLSFSPLNQLKFPANKTFPKCKTARKETSTNNSENDDNVSTSYGRRELLFMSATLPLIFPLQESVPVYADDQLGANEYLFIRDEIRNVLTKNKAAGMLRLVFHDAGTFEGSDNSGGMNGSIIYEVDRPENKGLKKSLKILEKAKLVVENKQPVSWADMIAVAGAEAVLLCGGPGIPVRLGRIDAQTADPEGRLPEETLDAPRLKQCFQRKGFFTQELIALSGAHTLGSKGFGNPTVFDNSYYKILLEKPWTSSGGMSGMVGLPSDRALMEDDECLRWINRYANDENLFFEDFKNAYIKLINSGARWEAS